ncbi:MAG TPA: hypothetical protein PKY31_16625 [Spirochaetota bacterium]|nr:hypothetical protein [Spirochaetota bacterium]
MSSGKKDLLRSLHNSLADVQRYIVDADRRDFETISQDYAARVLRDIEGMLLQCVEKADGL